VREALAVSTKDKAYNDKAGQRTERAINRAAWGKEYDGQRPIRGTTTRVQAEGETTVGRSRTATPSMWQEDVKSFHKLRAAGKSAAEAWRIIRESSRQLNEPSSTPKRVPDAGSNIPRALQEGQRLAPEGNLRSMKGQLPRSPVGSLVSGIAVTAIAGQAITELHEGHPGAAAKTIGVGAALFAAAKRYPAVIPLTVMVGTIAAYDENVQKHADAAGGWVERFTGRRWAGAAAASAEATGESLFQGTFGTAGRAIGQGAAVGYIRLTSDEYTLVPWRSQIWADIFD
jgi:hypothetical protein